MRDAIAALAKVGQICQLTNGHWLIKALLAPKPHQEHVRHINKFVWPFCVIYIPLNMVTRIIAYPIPCCDSAINEDLGMGKPWGITNWPLPSPVRRRLHSETLLPSNGPRP